MILAEKLAQKLHNLKSKGELRDFFIFFDENRTLELNTRNSFISPKEDPNHYSENTYGNYMIIWNSDEISHGSINSESINDFEDFFAMVKTTKIPQRSDIFIPKRGIYPMVMTYSKQLADMIDIPEYLLRISDLTNELDQMLKVHGESNIIVQEGTRYAYSSEDLDECYPYTRFNIHKAIEDDLLWNTNHSEIPSMVKLQELFSFLGDTHNMLDHSTKSSIKKGDINSILLCPSIFKKLFTHQIIENLKISNILTGGSCFTTEDIAANTKFLGTVSISYDPLINHKPGTYKFTTFGMKPQKQYLVKFGKINQPISNSLNCFIATKGIPSIEVSDISNVKFEGIKKKTFDELKKSGESFLFCLKDANYQRTSSTTSHIYLSDSLIVNRSKVQRIENFSTTIDLIDLCSLGRVELVEYVDGQVGCKINL